MTSFREVPIGDVVVPANSWNPARSAPERVFRYIDLSAVDQDTKKVVGDREVTCAEAPSRARQLVSKGDVLVSTVRPNLNGVAKVPPALDGATASTGFCILRPSQDRLDGGFLFHWVKTPRFVDDMVRKATGASYPAVSDKIVCESTIPLPPLPEQKRIAAILDKADELRAKRRAALAELDTLVQSIFLEMFGDPVTNPKGWKVEPLGRAMSEVYRYPTYYGITYEPKGVPEIRGELLQDDGSIVTDWDRLRFISAQTSARFPRTVLSEGDLVLSVRGTIGKVGLVPTALAGSNITANLMRMSPNRAILHPVFAWHFTQTDFFQRELATASSSTTILTIKAPTLKAIPFFVPSLALQRTFAARVAAVEKLKAAHRASLAEFDALFASLQHRAFRGELGGGEKRRGNTIGPMGPIGPMRPMSF